MMLAGAAKDDLTKFYSDDDLNRLTTTERTDERCYNRTTIDKRLYDRAALMLLDLRQANV